MYKDLINKHLNNVVTESAINGLSTTTKTQKEEDKVNKQYYNDVKKKMADYDKASKQDDKNAIEPVKHELDSEEETYHDEMEIRNGMEMLKYDNSPDANFKKRTEMAIKGDPTMGNKTYEGDWNPETGEGNGNTEEVWGSSGGKKIGDDIVKSANASSKKRNDAEYNIIQLGDDIEQSGDKNTRGKARKIATESISEASILADKNYTHFAIYKNSGKIIEAWNYKGIDNEELTADKDAYFFNDLRNNIDGLKKGDVKIVSKGWLSKNGINPNESDSWDKTRYTPSEQQEQINNNDNINETKMKRLRFKKPFNGVGNALQLIPESYRTDSKEFEMTDGNESYRMRWEGTLSEGRAVILTASDSNMVNEDIQKMKHLMGYDSKSTLGTLKGGERLTENDSFRGMMDKTKKLLSESEDMDDTDETVDEGLMGWFTGENNIKAFVTGTDLGKQMAADYMSGISDQELVTKYARQMAAYTKSGAAGDTAKFADLQIKDVLEYLRKMKQKSASI